MPVLRHPAGGSAELVAAVEAAGASFTAAWARAADAVQARVSVAQLRALQVLAEQGGMNLNGLADELGVIPSSASRLCDRLVAAGLLRRELSKTDRREVTLSLRPAGLRLLDQLQQARCAELAAVLDRMAPAAARALVRGLEEFARAAAPVDRREQEA